MLQLLCFFVWYFFPNQKFLIPTFINYMLFSLKIPYKIDGMFQTSRFIMDTLMLPEL